ncbi:PREDICTED: angiopoietin-2-like isoform X8 [Nanorana parkeri]|uniref:angiopoietin-2-like isoform X8 n=1 Tax=Nanorana parkeri TaxID=125878 RepID=UPI000854A58A|nr:PREDICTED: angiopoietin-2-like isoform X8 [Nanorana parkeri]
MNMVLGLITHCLLLTLVNPVVGSHLKGMEINDKRHHKIQHGHCSYTFLLPEIENCYPPPADYQVSNSLQRDAPAQADLHWPSKRIEELESIMENNTQWLHKVMNQTNRLEIQLLENSLSTNRLEKELLQQSQEINMLREKNSFLENRVLQMEEKHREEIDVLKSEKLHVEDVLSKQSGLIGELEQQLNDAVHNNTILQRQQAQLMETVGQLASLVSQYNHIPIIPKEEQMSFRDCADAYKSGLTSSGIYMLRFSNSTDTVKALCDMDTSGGGWTVIQHRKDGSVNFHRTWKEYREGFGTPSGEYWLGNEFVHQLTSQGSNNLRIQLRDWDGNEAYSLYDTFSLGNEELNYRLNLRGYSGTAGRTSSFSPAGTNFSTKDVDNDRCSCKCAQIATGGWWFDACGPSNLNGIYYPSGSGTAKYNGIKWHYWKGPSHGLKSVTMMIRSTDF